MDSKSRTDRILIAIALLVLLIATGLFYFDGWMWGGRNRGGDRIGVLISRSGDVRMKYNGDLQWQRAARGEDLVYDDAIYAGDNSEANLQLGNSQMTVSSNTLVVLRKEGQANFLNLSYGSLFGKLAKNEKIFVDTGSGKPIELSTEDKAKVVIKKVGGKTELHVTEGVAHIKVNGKVQRITPARSLVMEGNKRVKATPLLKAVQPLSKDVLYSDEPTRIPFAWKWSDSHSAGPSDRYTLEFSSSPKFDHIHATKVVQGQLATSMSVSQSLSLYYRVRGPNGEVSQTERVNFTRLDKPVIVSPVAQTQYNVSPGQLTPVNLKFIKPKSTSLIYQISQDPEFKQNQIERKLALNSNEFVEQQGVGQYFIRARADYGGGHMTGWTPSVPYQILPAPATLSKAEIPSRVLIPNLNYPPNLYSASPAKVNSFLRQHGMLKNFFGLKSGDYDGVNLKLKGHPATLAQKSASWPRIRPGHYQYKYQVVRNGSPSSPWSDDKSLDIGMEPPKPAGDPVYGKADKSGAVPTQWRFTPLLYAKSYDVEVSHDPDFKDAHEISAKTPQISTKLSSNGPTYWRARARDQHGHLISGFSPAYALNPPQPTPQTLAANPKQDRQPASTETTRTKVEKEREEPYRHNGWWAWLGGGTNVVDYKQSIPGRGTFNSPPKFTGPSQYFETGYGGKSGWGGVFTYKQTPGKVNVTNVALNGSDFSWTTLSIEGVMQEVAPFTVLNRPIVYGLRLGIQKHKMPYIFLDGGGDLQLKTNDMTAASAGLLAEWRRNRWTYYWLMRYQFPLSTTAEGGDQFSITPKFAFDGSIGTAYNITQQIKLGLFWYGQWHQYNFVYSDGLTTNEGFQSLFYSDIDLRLGIDF